MIAAPVCGRIPAGRCIAPPLARVRSEAKTQEAHSAFANLTSQWSDACDEVLSLAETLSRDAPVLLIRKSYSLACRIEQLPRNSLVARSVDRLCLGHG